MNTRFKPEQILERADGIAAHLGRENIRDSIVTALYSRAESIAARVVKQGTARQPDWDRKLDNIITSKLLGYPLMLALLGIIFWITISAANIPSQLLARLLFGLEDLLSALLITAGAPVWLHDLLLQGLYRTMAWVVSVMLPPMAIFFPLFTLLEDLGYLPRVAFNLDNLFKKAGAHGKQALTMCMGFGCNAAGVISCRIVDSPRERLIAILTNNFSPCNGRFPTLIALATIFMGGLVTSAYRSLTAATVVVGTILLSIAMMFFTSWLLSRTILKGVPSLFTLELPPYRCPRVLQVLVRSLLDRTIFVLARAVIVAAPAGIIIWILANIEFNNLKPLNFLAGWLQPLGMAIGMDGYILLAFILGLPANEIVLPILLMCYLSTCTLTEAGSLADLSTLLIQNGWTWLTAFCVMLFSLMHWPCGTTLLTIFKETRSLKWTLLAAVIPTICGVAVCFLFKQIAALLEVI